MANTFTLTVTEEHLDNAIEEYHKYGDRCINCVIAQAAREQVEGFCSCGSYNITTNDSRLECEDMKKFTLNFDKGRYDMVRSMLPAQLKFVNVGEF